MEALRFSGASTTTLESLDEAAWERLLTLCDHARLTLALDERCRAVLPESVRRKIESRRARNAERYARILRAYDEISAALDSFLVLKGFTLAPAFVSDARLRQQYDLDLFCPPEAVLPARDALLRLGYEPLGGVGGVPVDHLPVMVRKSGWQWRGDYFDPEIPVSVDVHFRFWDRETERFDAPGLEEFWPRRAELAVDGRSVPALSAPDALAYHVLHVVRHLLRGSARLSSVYELAWFLENGAGDTAFWRTWYALHPAPLRRIEAIGFGLAAEWFDCQVGEAAQEAIGELPEDVRAWFDGFAASPVEGLFRPSKDELWLHLCLVESARDKWSVVRRRLAPARLPGLAETGGRSKYLAFLGSRMVYHVRALAPTLVGGARWWARGLGRPYWTFLGTAALYNFGLFIFFLLYNLYLLDRGFQEEFLGLVTGAMVAGSIAGTLPAGALAHKAGLRRCLLAGFLGVPLISALRALVGGQPALLALAFLGGLVSSLWFVSIAPAIAQLAPERKRALGYSLFFCSGIGLGALAGLVGGRLPGLLTGAGGAVQAKQLALLAGCLLAGLAALPAARLRFSEAPAMGQRRIWPRSPFLARFLVAIGVWSLATGAFNPFFNAYFARHLRARVDQIGLIFSGAQLAQAASLLLAPALLRRWGAIRAVAGMQAAAGLALAALAVAPAGAPATLAYTGYVVFQWMSEPGLYTLLMSRVSPAERSGASALNFLVIFSAQAAAAALAGAAIARFDYPAVLTAAAAVAVIAGLLFRWLLPPSDRASPADSVPR